MSEYDPGLVGAGIAVLLVIGLLVIGTVYVWQEHKYDEALARCKEDPRLRYEACDSNDRAPCLDQCAQRLTDS